MVVGRIAVKVSRFHSLGARPHEGEHHDLVGA
jgi:hypothetical protein